MSAFLDLRPDGYAVHQKSKRLAILEFTRAMDSSDDNFRKTLRNGKGTPQCWNSLTRYQTDRVGLYYSSILQSGFVARSQLRIGTDPLSFVSTLKALGISSRVNLEKIRKRVAKRTFEAHDLMLRSYYAVKFSSSSSVDLSRILGNSFALQHCLRLPI